MSTTPDNPIGYRIAGRMSASDLTRVDGQSRFADRIRQLFREIRPTRLVETGTYHGTGTTTIIAQALKDLALHDATFFSIEVNPKNYSKALAHLTREGLNVRLLNGLSVPRAILPTRQDIERRLVKDVIADGLVVDHEPENRVEFYFRETDFPHLPDALLDHVLAEFGGRLDFALLDSGGHMGHLEFEYLVSRLRFPCWLALDDIHHVKHHQSFQRIQTDPRFAIEAVGQEKFGYCIARFTPESQRRRERGAA